jgi:hypothetical protein
MLKCVGRLYFIHMTAWLAILTAMYFPAPVGIIFASVYLLILFQEGQYLAGRLRGRLLKSVTAAVLWQLPALLLISVRLLRLQQLGSFYYDGFFMLELWQTPLLPLLSLLPGSWLIQGRPPYYYLYYIDILALMLWIVFPTLLYRRRARRYWF